MLRIAGNLALSAALTTAVAAAETPVAGAAAAEKVPWDVNHLGTCLTKEAAKCEKDGPEFADEVVLRTCNLSFFGLKYGLDPQQTHILKIC